MLKIIHYVVIPHINETLRADYKTFFIILLLNLLSVYTIRNIILYYMVVRDFY